MFKGSYKSNYVLKEITIDGSYQMYSFDLEIIQLPIEG